MSRLCTAFPIPNLDSVRATKQSTAEHIHGISSSVSQKNGPFSNTLAWDSALCVGTMGTNTWLHLPVVCSTIGDHFPPPLVSVPFQTLWTVQQSIAFSVKPKWI